MDRVKAVVIGGGIVGVSVLYHLAKFGWRDVLLLERSELTAGSTWHAAAGFHAINGDPNVARLQAYTIDLYKEVEDLGEQSCGLHMTGGLTVAASASRWEWLRAEWARQQMIGLHSRLVTPEEVKELCPLMDIAGIRGGVFDPSEGHLDPNGATYAFAKAAGKLGARTRTRTKVRGLVPQKDGSWVVELEDGGELHAEHVINAAGLWAPRVGEMVGLTLPIVPMEHMYVVTEDIASVGALSRELPMTADLDANIYLRQEQRAVLLGVYEPDPLHWHVDGVPWDFGMELIPDNLERIMEPLMRGFERFPDLENAGIRRVINGGMVFSPDGNPIIGPVAGVKNYWCACGSMAGFSQCGAIGKSLAEWMVYGTPSSDVQAMDVARFGPHDKGRYLLEKTSQNYARRLQLTYPNEQLPAGRPYKTTPLYPVQKAQNAVFGESYGQEYPLYFANSAGEVENPTFRRSNAFATVAEECQAVRNRAGLLDSSGFAKYRVTGSKAESWVGKILAGRLPAPGRLRLAPMLNHQGRLLGDLTLFRLEPDEFMIFGSGYMQAIHMRWFLEHLQEGVRIDNVTDDYTGLALSGPKSLEIAERVIGPQINTLPLFGVRRVEAGPIPAIVGRLSITGECGLEFYVSAQHQFRLQSALMEAGVEHGLRMIGLYAANSLRLEKAYGVWSREFTADHTPREAGLDRFVDYDRQGFIGREKALEDRDAEPGRRLVTLVVQAVDADSSGFEPVWHDEHLIGYTTSGGYGHVTGESLALAYLDGAFAVEGAEVDVHILGDRRPARVSLTPRYDPAGDRLRKP